MWEKLKLFFNKFKSWLVGILGAVIAFLLMILKIKNNKIDNLETENKVADVEIKTTEIANENERATNEAVNNVNEKSQETLNDIKKGDKSYNDIIEEWNAKK